MGHVFSEMYISRKDNGKKIYLTKYESENSVRTKNILMVHGLTSAQFVFDIKCKDYSMCDYFARKGYTVWRLDIGGYGKSEKYENGWDVTTENAAKDQVAVLEKIREIQQVDKVYLLGWSWGTMTTAKTASLKEEYIEKMVWLGPCFGGTFPALSVEEPFVAIDDEYINRMWQQGAVSQEVDFMLYNAWNVLAYAQEGGKLRPAGGAKELMEAGEKWLIKPEKIHVPVLIITGGNDIYTNFDRCSQAIKVLPEGSKWYNIENAGHAMHLEKKYYKKTREEILKFIES